MSIYPGPACGKAMRGSPGGGGEVGGGYCHICEGFSSSLVWDRLVYRYHRVMARRDDNSPGN